MSIVFSKYSGSGNDFIIIDNRNGQAKDCLNAGFVKKICERGLSVGADGVFFIEQSDHADFKWDFFNADGSSAAMCGNGSRCAARYAYLNGIAPKNMSFETGAGIIEATVRDDGEVKVLLTKPHPIERNISLSAAGKDVVLSFINTGVPHAVVFFDDVSKADVQNMGRELRYHGYFAPKGTNVNFVEVTGYNDLKVRTYERGVEGETLACGTGSVASVLVSIDKKLVESPVRVLTSGGKTLTVYLEGDKVYLQGEARHIFTGELNAEAYKY